MCLIATLNEFEEYLINEENQAAQVPSIVTIPPWSSHVTRLNAPWSRFFRSGCWRPIRHETKTPVIWIYLGDHPFSPLSISINFRWTPRLSSDSSSFFLRPSMNFCISWVWRCALLLCWGYLSRFFEPSVGCSTCGCFSSVSSKLLWGLNIVFGCFCFYITYIIVDEWAPILDPYPAHQATSSHLTRKKQVYNL